MRDLVSKQLMRRRHTEPRDGYDPNSVVLRVEFTGSPFDGHEQLWFATPTRLPAEVVWLLCEDAFRLLDGQSRHSTGAFTSVALSELEKANFAYRYRFVRAFQ
jgi:hypothetical protein